MKWPYVRGLTREQRFWPKVQKTEGCWQWLAGREITKRGKPPYGRFQWSCRRAMLAHRAAWMLTHGDIPPGKWVLHHCDNKLCVRPEHLYLGNSDDNIRDRVVRGRSARGEKAGARLNEAQVRMIRAIYTEILIPHGSLARAYEVPRGTLRSILYRRTWRHLEG